MLKYERWFVTQNDVELSNGTLAGMSTLRRSGTATIDTVVDWNFLYANIALGPIEVKIAW